MIDSDKLETLQCLYQYLVDRNFDPLPNEKYVLESIITHQKNSGTLLFTPPLLIYKSLIFSHNFLEFFFEHESDFLDNAKEMLEHKEPLQYIKQFIQ